MKIAYKKSLFKIIGASALATCMLATSLFAFIPNTTQAKTLNSNQSLSDIQSNTSTTESTGLITPRADDPVLFTTESGLEIKYGNSSFYSSLGTGNLSGFPYFKTNDNSKEYVWIIIGANSNYSNIYTLDTFTPAGIAINNDAKVTLAEYLGTKLSSSLVKTDEVPENCFLVLANDIVGTNVYNTSYCYYTPNSYNYIENSYVATENIKLSMDSYYTNGSFGLNSIKSNIQSVTITTYFTYNKGGSSSWSGVTESVSAHIFPLGCGEGSSYVYSTYLTDTQMKLSTNQWIRGSVGHNSGYTLSGNFLYFNAHYINTSGTNTSMRTNSSAGYRPAFVMSLV